MKVIITGAGGFLGSHLALAFAKQGIQVFAVTRKPCEALEGKENIFPLVGALDADDLREALPKDADALLHLAWAGVAPESRNDFALQRSNIGLALEAARLAKDINAKRFVLPGSTLEYAYSGQPVNRFCLPSPQNAYAAAKISARYFCESFCRAEKLPFIYAVISGIYGPDRKDSNVISYAIRELLCGRKPSFTPLEQKWDYVHISDVERAFALICEKGKDGAFYAVGHGDNCPLADYILQIRDAIDPSLPLGIGDLPYPNGLMPNSCVDLSELQTDTGFVPQVAFSDGIRSVIDAMRDSNRQTPPNPFPLEEA